MEDTTYKSKFETRYADEYMNHLFSDKHRHEVWRRLWAVLAECERQLGLDISKEQIQQIINAPADKVNDISQLFERQTHHDVMAYIKALGVCCPDAKPIIHLGATSCYIVDNADVIIMTEAMEYIREQINYILEALRGISDKYAGVTTLAYTHLQAAQPTTVGKRVTLWMQDLKMDLEQINNQLNNIKILGCRGATGTSASFLELFGDPSKVLELDNLIERKLGFKTFSVSGQTYPRKQDFWIMQTLSSIAQSASKFANDIRFLQHLGEISEPFGNNQVGSSAMPYKKNPIDSEKINSLSRYVICNAQNFAFTASSQFLERTLDDSANRRVVIPEMFIAISEILNTYYNIAYGLRVNEWIIAEHVNEQVPALVSEGILMECVKKGGDRQELHERMREYLVNSNTNFINAVLRDSAFDITPNEIDNICNRLAGMAEIQTKRYLEEYK